MTLYFLVGFLVFMGIVSMSVFFKTERYRKFRGISAPLDLTDFWVAIGCWIMAALTIIIFAGYSIW